MAGFTVTERPIANWFGASGRLRKNASSWMTANWSRSGHCTDPSCSPKIPCMQWPGGAPLSMAACASSRCTPRPGSARRNSYRTRHRLLWQHDLSVRPGALAAVGDHLLLGGGRDRIDPRDPLSTLACRAGGLLHVLGRSDGASVNVQELPAPPVHEGVIAVSSGGFVCLKDGTVIKLHPN